MIRSHPNHWLKMGVSGLQVCRKRNSSLLRMVIPPLQTGILILSMYTYTIGLMSLSPKTGNKLELIDPIAHIASLQGNSEPRRSSD